MKIEKKCIKCGTRQKGDKSKSTPGWTTYDNKAKCKCGGKFGTYLDGKLIGGD